LSETEANQTELGRGRSGVVFRCRDEAGRDVARKIFSSDSLTKAVHYICSGAPGAYTWNEQAVRSAVLRRRIAGPLVQMWFGDRLRVAEAYGHEWLDQRKAFRIDCRHIDGRHVRLHHPFTEHPDGQLRDLRRNVMKPLQRHLAEAGLDGLVWQAGRGNPVSLNNFLHEPSGDDADGRWTWIDLESGVPALIPINPLDLILFYLPMSFRHRRALFDDVDVPKLSAYVTAKQDELAKALGAQAVAELATDIEALGESQRQWKSMPRHMRSITYRLLKGSITRKQADWYARHPASWYVREMGRVPRVLLRGAVGLALKAITRLRRINLLKAAKACWMLVWSERYREHVAQQYVAHRIDRWQTRGQLTDGQAEQLRAHLEAEEASAYLTDFGVHLGVKPFVKTMQWWVLSPLFATGHMHWLLYGLLMVEGGAIVRTAYTLGRVIQNTMRRREKPWIALAVGTLPMIGNLAFPVQILFSSAHTGATIAQFILYDTFARLGRAVPIWGGHDTLSEHLFNRLPDTLIRRTAGRSHAEPTA